MMRQGIDTLEIDQMAAPQAQGIETLGSMEDAPMIPDGGIKDAVPEATEMLAAAGREGDVYIIHAAEGDTVIPEEVLAGEDGPQIREMLFRQMAQMGVDPERYVVGNELNSINPETGLPEFFFKKIFKSVKKFFKKAAPIILPIALNFLLPGLGTIAAGAIGSGIGTLIQGGSAKDALKAAAFGGITAGVMSGVSGAIGGEGFMAGVESGLPSTMGGGSTVPFTSTEKLGGLGKSPVDVMGGEGSIFKGVGKPTLEGGGFKDTFGVTPVADAWKNPDTNLLADFDTSIPYRGLRPPAEIASDWPYTSIKQFPKVGEVPRLNETSNVVRRRPPSDNYWWSEDAAEIANAPESLPPGTRPPVEHRGLRGRGPWDTIQPAQQDQSFLNKYLFEGAGDVLPEGYGGTTKLEYALRSNPADQAYIDKIKGLVATKDPTTGKPLLSIEKAQSLVAQRLKGDPSYSQYLGPLALAGIGAYAGGFFDEPEQEEFKSTFGDPIPQSLVDRFRVDTGTYAPRAPINFSQFPTTQSAAYGGEMQNFPPRIGAISGPGTEKSDDVPAMLSDGEFVMTARAVRGAGNGSRRQGVKNLYDIMRNFEAVV